MFSSNNKDSYFIEEMYLGFQVIVLILLLSMAFPLHIENNDNYLKIYTILFFSYLLYNLYSHFEKYNNSFRNNDLNFYRTLIIESILLFVFLNIKLNSKLPLSNIVFGFTLIQSIRFPSKAIYLIIISCSLETYILLLSNIKISLIDYFSNCIFILFISLCVTMIFKEIFRLQEENKCYMVELKNTNSKLHKLANYDYLTGLYNHKHFKSTINNLDSYYCNNIECFSLAFIDIDNFKKINDNFGHLTGDYVLAELAKLIKISIRKNDFAARYGGEEFVIIFPSTSNNEARALCERIRKKIESTDIITDSYKINITVSIGLGHISKKTSTNINDFIKNVDKKLYFAKETGKNKVISDFYIQ